MMRVLYIALTLIGLQLAFTNCNSQTKQKEEIVAKKSFCGALKYKITPRDSSLRSLIPTNQMIFVTNDTIVRSERATQQLGLQITLRHIEKNKTILLLDTEIGKYAIQTDLNKKDSLAEQKQDTTSQQFTFKKKLKKKKFFGKKANTIRVSHPLFEEDIDFLYFKGYSNKYTSFYPEINGILVRFSIITEDGIMDYELVDFQEFIPNKDLFGVPSDYQKTTFDDFIELWLNKDKEG